MKICTKCKGRKKTSDLGFMEYTCVRCGGTGLEDDCTARSEIVSPNLLTKVEEKLNGESTSIKAGENQKAKRGRPKKAA